MSNERKDGPEMLGVFVWQGWVFIAFMIGVPIIVAAVLGRGKQ